VESDSRLTDWKCEAVDYTQFHPYQRRLEQD
jgi:hypothetical protein